mgnify:CR=1 FL=1
MPATTSTTRFGEQNKNKSINTKNYESKIFRDIAFCQFWLSTDDDDNTGTLGMSMLPDSDGISATTTTFDVTTKSLLAEKVYAKDKYGIL